MNTTTLACSQKSLIYLPNPKPSSPWKQPVQVHPILPTSVARRLDNQSKATWRVEANAKGFGASSAMGGSEIDEKTLNKKNNSNNSGGSGGGDDEDEQLPEHVFNRVIWRVVVSVGAPIALGIAQLYFFGVLKEEHIWDYPKWLPIITTFLTFGASTFGIAYGALSTSLDPDREGSLLGFEEAKLNWVEMWKEDDESKKKNRR